jgi:hypothetical protein
MSGVGRARVLSCLLLSLVTIACRDDPPDKEIQQAQAAVDTAASAGADDYAHDEITAARDAIKRAREAVDQRDYRLALNNALDGRERAENAAKEAADKKVAARTDADHAIAEANAALDEARSKLRSEPRSPSRSMIAARRTVLDGEKALQEARTAFDRGDYKAVTSKLPESMERVRAAERNIQENQLPAARRRR